MVFDHECFQHMLKVIHPSPVVLGLLPFKEWSAQIVILKRMLMDAAPVQKTPMPLTGSEVGQSLLVSEAIPVRYIPLEDVDSSPIM